MSEVNFLRSEFLAGAKCAVPVILSAAPFGALFGAIAVDNGFTVAEAVFMSGIVFAGASQMVGLELFGQNVAPWLIVLSIFAVNFRHVLYSAAIGRHFAFGSEWKRHLAFFLMTDPQFAESEARVNSGKRLTFAWYMGMGAPLYVLWVALAWAGATFGTLIENPRAWGLDTVLAIYFFGLLLSVRKRAHWLPVVAVSAVASILAFKTIGSPWHVSVGAFAGVLVAAFVLHPGSARS
jgi:predicted branched-subunit amino acid permease